MAARAKRRTARPNGNGKLVKIAQAALVHEPAARCGARKRAEGVEGEPCRNRAGYKTDHVGIGRCFVHGGRSLIKHGRYSSIKREEIRALIEQYESDPDPLDILPELAVVRGLLHDYVERYDEWREAFLAWHASFGEENGNAKPREVLDIADAYRLASEATKIVERIENIQAKNAVSRPELLRIFQELWRAVEVRVTDVAIRDTIRNDWLSVRL